MTTGDGNPPHATTPPPGWTVNVVATTGSTNDDLAAAATSGAATKTVLVARHQTAGRGRLDRRWDAPPGTNLLASLLLDEPVDRPGAAMRSVALAAAAASRRLAGVSVELKWPNDLLVHERKLAGLLARRVADGRVVVGIGLNVAWCPDGAARLGADIDPLDLLAALLEEWDSLPPSVQALDDRYEAELGTIGRRVRVDMGNGDTLVGTATGLAEGGRLVLATADGRQRTIDAGDVVHLRGAT